MSNAVGVGLILPYAVLLGIAYFVGCVLDDDHFADPQSKARLRRMREAHSKRVKEFKEMHEKRSSSGKFTDFL